MTGSHRTRRSSAQVRQLITEAASADFLENGFERTTIRSVARRAQVTESAVFRHFESKVELFRATAVAPLARFMDDFARSLDVEPQQDPREVSTRFARELYALCSSNREILASLTSGAGEKSDTARTSMLEPCLQTLIEGVYRYMEKTGSEASTDTRFAVRLAVSLILGTALTSRALFPPETDDSEIPVALAEFILYGAGYRPDRTTE